MNTERKKKEKRVGIKYLKTKESTVFGTEPSAILLASEQSERDAI